MTIMKQTLYCENCQIEVAPEYSVNWNPVALDEIKKKCPRCGGRLRSKADKISGYVKLGIVGTCLVLACVLTVIIFGFILLPAINSW